MSDDAATRATEPSPAPYSHDDMLADERRRKALEKAGYRVVEHAADPSLPPEGQATWRGAGR